jgi:hypothetical protein
VGKKMVKEIARASEHARVSIEADRATSWKSDCATESQSEKGRGEGDTEVGSSTGRVSKRVKERKRVSAGKRQSVRDKNRDSETRPS